MNIDRRILITILFCLPALLWAQDSTMYNPNTPKQSKPLPKVSTTIKLKSIMVKGPDSTAIKQKAQNIEFINLTDSLQPDTTLVKEIEPIDVKCMKIIDMRSFYIFNDKASMEKLQRHDTIGAERKAKYPNLADCSTYTLPAIDFDKYTLVYVYETSAGCAGNHLKAANLKYFNNQKLMRLDVEIEALGSCLEMNYFKQYFLIPKIKDGYTLVVKPIVTYNNDKYPLPKN